MSRLKTFETLTKQRDFDAVYRRADKVWHTPSFVLFYRSGPGRRVAFVAGKKVGKAVARNRAKRLMRALFLGSVERIGTGNYILVAKAPILQTPFLDLQKSWNTALKRSGALAGQ